MKTINALVFKGNLLCARLNDPEITLQWQKIKRTENRGLMADYLNDLVKLERIEVKERESKGKVQKVHR